jgi:hypothetical protein
MTACPLSVIAGNHQQINPLYISNSLSSNSASVIYVSLYLIDANTF